ncbi:hypothetical protein H2200_011424 [Cladophialophora chaetospira]|uniref:Enoyl reductase (ER) domain-containing protein n=1 Tax=Cladophialophora chaetospira TaxID=386627 RepID=A0AA38WZD7_9EURO|nr:hypothetical protein H2200_011424 [Cladophialophora chaetospira]
MAQQLSNLLPETMQEVIITPGPRATLQTVPTPHLLPNQILTRVIYTGTNPKDWKRAENAALNQRINQGDDFSGIIALVGSEVKNFRAGDRVACLHQPATSGGSFAQYAVSYDFATVHIPETVGFAEAATLPLVYNTAAVALYGVLGLPTPFAPVVSGKKVGLVVYGASTSVGVLALQLARLSNSHPIIAIAGASTSFIKPLLDESKGDVLLDYRAGSDAVISAAKSALSSSGVDHIDFALDCVSEGTTTELVAQILGSNGTVARLLPVPENLTLPNGVKAAMTVSTSVFAGAATGRETFTAETELANAFFRLLERGLAGGWIKPLPYEVVAPEKDGGWWTAVEKALQMLKAGEARGEKFVVRIGQE